MSSFSTGGYAGAAHYFIIPENLSIKAKVSLLFEKISNRKRSNLPSDNLIDIQQDVLGFDPSVSIEFEI